MLVAPLLTALSLLTGSTPTDRAAYPAGASGALTAAGLAPAPGIAADERTAPPGDPGRPTPLIRERATEQEGSDPDGDGFAWFDASGGLFDGLGRFAAPARSHAGGPFPGRHRFPILRC